MKRSEFSHSDTKSANKGNTKNVKELLLYALIVLSFTLFAFISLNNILEQNLRIKALQKKNTSSASKSDSLRKILDSPHEKVIPVVTQKEVHDIVYKTKFVHDTKIVYEVDTPITNYLKRKLNQSNMNVELEADEISFLNQKFYKSQRKLRDTTQSYIFCRDTVVPSLKGEIDKLNGQLDTCKRKKNSIHFPNIFRGL